MKDERVCVVKEIPFTIFIQLTETWKIKEGTLSFKEVQQQGKVVYPVSPAVWRPRKPKDQSQPRLSSETISQRKPNETV